MKLEQEILEFIVTELVQGDDVELKPDTDLLCEGVLDSTAMVELIVWLEESYGFSVDIDDLTPETFGSVGKIAEYVSKNSNIDAVEKNHDYS